MLQFFFLIFLNSRSIAESNVCENLSGDKQSVQHCKEYLDASINTLITQNKASFRCQEEVYKQLELLQKRKIELCKKFECVKPLPIEEQIKKFHPDGVSRG